MMLEYDPTNWYWIVGGDETQIYSSAGGDYVPADNIVYLNWRQSGKNPTRIANETELGEVLASNSVRPVNPNMLISYRRARVDKITIQDVAVYLFQLENRLRACERAAGQTAPNLTAPQFRTMLRNMV